MWDDPEEEFEEEDDDRDDDVDNRFGNNCDFPPMEWAVGELNEKI